MNSVYLGPDLECTVNVARIYSRWMFHKAIEIPRTKTVYYENAFFEVRRAFGTNMAFLECISEGFS